MISVTELRAGIVFVPLQCHPESDLSDEGSITRFFHFAEFTLSEVEGLSVRMTGMWL